MNIGFIGAGNVGKAFGKYLMINGINVIGYYSKTYKSAFEAAEFTNTIAFNSIKEVSIKSDIIFITTNDDEIENVLNELIDTKSISKGQILVHMSGSSSSRVLIKAKKIGCFIYSLHPLQSFADINKSVGDLKNTYFSIEGDKEKIDVLENILVKTNNKYFIIDSENKSLYHIAACVVSNYLVTLIDYGLDIFNTIGINEKDAFKALYPLIEGTIKNIDKMGTKNALTGPILRGDIKTIENHMRSLLKLDDKKDFYSFMGLMTLEIAKEKNLSKDRHDRLNKLFKEVL